MTSVPACSSDLISDCAPVTLSAVLTGAAFAFVGSGCASWLPPCSPLTSGVALPDLVGVCSQLVHRMVERLLGVGRLLVGHPVVIPGCGHVGLLGVEVALEELLVGLALHVQ